MKSTFKQTTEELAGEERFSRVADDLDLAILQLGKSNETCQGAGYVVGGYFRTVLNTPSAQLGDPFLSYEKEINSILDAMRAISTRYFLGQPGVHPPTQSEIININIAVESYCNFHLAVLEYLEIRGTPLSTEGTVETLNDMSHDANRGRDAALTIQNRLNEFSQQLTIQSHSMRDIVDRLGVTAGVVRDEIERSRQELDALDVNIGMYEQALATKNERRLLVTAPPLRSTLSRRDPIQGIALMGSPSAISGEARQLRDSLAYLHARRASVYGLIDMKEEALVSAESYDEYIRIQGARMRQAHFYMGNIANAWLSQVSALGEIRRITVQENMDSTLLLSALKQAEQSIRFVFQEAQRIRQDMLSIALHEEPKLTLSEVYTHGISSMSHAEWEHPNVEREVIKQSLIEKYGKR